MRTQQKLKKNPAAMPKICWVVTDGTAGTFAQAMGLAEAMQQLPGIQAITIQHKIFRAAIPFTAIPFPFFHWLARLSARICLTRDSHKLEGPWPDIIIGCGRRVIPSLLYIKKASRGKTFCVYVLDPRIPAKNFNLVIKMPHDPIEGSNVITTPLSLNRINKAKLAEEAKKFQPTLKKFPAPYYTILIGGDTKNYKMSETACLDLLSQIKAIVAKCPGSILITPSRRTPKPLIDALTKLASHSSPSWRAQRSHPEQNCFARLDGHAALAMTDLKLDQVGKLTDDKLTSQNSKIFLHDLASTKDNPYFAMLAAADLPAPRLREAGRIFVTNDSVNMISEACTCCQDVQLLPLLGLNKGRTIQFGKSVVAAGLASMFDGKNSRPGTSCKSGGLKTNNQAIASDVSRAWAKFFASRGCGKPLAASAERVAITSRKCEFRKKVQ